MLSCCALSPYLQQQHVSCGVEGSTSNITRHTSHVTRHARSVEGEGAVAAQDDLFVAEGRDARGCLLELFAGEEGPHAHRHAHAASGVTHLR